MNWILLGITGYVALQLLIGWWVSRSIKTESDYLLAGRTFGYPLAITSIFATWFGAETCIGSSGRVMDYGLFGAMADPLGYGLCILFLGLFFAVPLWRRGLTTLADLYRDRFSPKTEMIAALLMAPTSMLWAATQIRAFGQVISSLSEISVTAAISGAAAVVILYTVSGGLMADAITDMVQGVVVIIGLIILVIGVFGMPESPVSLSDLGSLIEARPSEPRPLMAYLEALAIPLVGSLVAQELVARTLASRTETVARRASLFAAGLYMCVGIIPILIGLSGSVLFPDLADTEQLLPKCAERYLHPILFVVFIGALVSAILSTVDSALLASGAIISHNVVQRLSPSFSEANKLRISRLLVVLSGVVAYGLALQGESVYALAESTSGFSSAGIITITVFGLFTSFGGEKSAMSALACGTVVWLVGVATDWWSYPYVVSLVSAIAVYAILAIGNNKESTR